MNTMSEQKTVTPISYYTNYHQPLSSEFDHSVGMNGASMVSQNSESYLPSASMVASSGLAVDPTGVNAAAAASARISSAYATIQAQSASPATMQTDSVQYRQPQYNDPSFQASSSLTNLEKSVTDKFMVSSERSRLQSLLHQQLSDSGWRDEMTELCHNIIKSKGIANVTLETLVSEILPKATASVPDSIRREMTAAIKEFVSNVR